MLARIPVMPAIRTTLAMACLDSRKKGTADFQRQEEPRTSYQNLAPNMQELGRSCQHC